MRETGMQGAVSYKRCSKIRVAFNVEMRETAPQPCFCSPTRPRFPEEVQPHHQGRARDQIVNDSRTIR
jgi:hypothetical protein